MLTNSVPAAMALSGTAGIDLLICGDSSKLGAVAVHRVCPLSTVTAILTDPRASAEAATPPVTLRLLLHPVPLFAPDMSRYARP